MRYKEKVSKLTQIPKEKVAKLREILTEIYQKKPLRSQATKFTQSLKNFLNLYLVRLIKVLKKKEKRCLSIDFGQGFLKIAYVESKGIDFKLLNYDLKNISPALENKKEIVNFINNFLKTNSIPEKEVYLTISEPDSIVIKHLNLPAIPKQEIEEAAKWQLKNEIPFGLEGTIFDWQIVKEYTDEEGTKKNEIVFVALEAQTVDKYLSIAGECSLQVLGISISPFNYANILRYSGENHKIKGIIDIGYKDSTLYIYKNNKLIFMRILPFSSEKLTQSLTTFLISDRGRLKLSYEEAENIKKTFGIPQEESPVLKDNISTTQVISLLRPFLEELIRELKRSFDYFSSNLQEENPDILYITGGGGNLKNLDVYLNKELNINVSKLPIPGCINTHQLVKEKLDKDQNQIINALGVTLAGPQGIYLLPPEIKAQRVESIEKISLRLIAFTVGMIFLLLLFAVRFQIRDYKNRLKNAQIHLQTIKEVKDLKQKLDLRSSLVNKIQKDKVPVDGLLKVISTIVPESINLDALVLEQESHILILRGTVSPKGDSVAPVLTDFMEKIETSLFFTEAALISSEMVGGIRYFEIRCDLVR